LHILENYSWERLRPIIPQAAEGWAMRIRKITVAVLTTFISTILLAQTQKPAGPMDLNSATKEQLIALEGVTAEIAERIASGRPYKSVDELRLRNIIDYATYERIKTKVKIVPVKATPKQTPVKAPFGTGPGEK
jgi:DNA uptake protein ComE-like DNA-binding protein